MSCTVEELPFDPTDYDKALGDLLLGHKGDAGAFLASVFSFLKRRSNFFKDSEPRRRVLDALRSVTGEPAGGDGFRAGFLGGGAAKQRQPAPAQPKPAAPPAAAAAAGTSSSSAAADAAAQAAPAPAAAGTSAAAGGGSEPGGAGAAPPPAAEAAPSPDAADAGAAAADAPDQASKGLKPNAGRGADLPNYSWSQTLHEVTINVPVGAGVKGRQLDVVIDKSHLRVGVKGQPPVVDGELSEPIKPDDAMWNLADGMVEITLTKAEGMHWWCRVLASDPAIDVQAVEPESSKLDDLDPETRQTVEKMMFDQRQKAMGLPTSEEMQKQDMLRKFMAAHPEMDFSNAKIM